MSIPTMGHGCVLGGRYRLEDLLSEHRGARFWRGTDTVLGRSVAVNALPGEDPRAADLLDAARRSATVSDSHLLRVLDCAADADAAWVVNEWGDGTSLDQVVEDGTLPPTRAAWLTREVAQTIATAHEHGVAHGRLAPEAVLVTESGSIKLIGFAVSAAISGVDSLADRARGRGYGELTPMQTDVVDLAGLLYAGLTGRWPGLAPSAMPVAPNDRGQPMRARQVRAGVPRLLDALCERVLRPDPSDRTPPIATAQEILAVLTDYLGDPLAAAPVDLHGIHTEPTVGMDRDRLREALGSRSNGWHDRARSVGAGAAWAGAAESLTDTWASQRTTATGDAPADPAAATPAGVTDVDPAGGISPSEDPADRGPASPADSEHQVHDAAAVDAAGDGAEATRRGPEPASADAEHAEESDLPSDPEPTQLALPLIDPAVDPAAPAQSRNTDEGAGRRTVADPEATQAAPLPPFVEQPAALPPYVEPPDRPLFADTERRVPEVAPAREPAGDPWFFADEPPTSAGDRGRGGDADDDDRDRGHPWRPAAIALIALIAVVVAVIAAVVYGVGHHGGVSGVQPTPTPTSTAPTTTAKPYQPVSVRDFDPEGNPPIENPAEVPLATDGNPATGWQTSTYRGNPRLGGLKSGVGLMIDLGSDRPIGSVSLILTGAPTSLTIYASPTGTTTPPASVSGMTAVGRAVARGTKVTVRASTSVKARYVVVWLTKLPQVGPGQYRAQVDEVAVRP